MAPRYPQRAGTPNRVTLDLDPITADALTDAAKQRKVTRDRLAYEFIQRGLEISTTPPPGKSVASEDESDLTFDWKRNTSPKASL